MEIRMQKFLFTALVSLFVFLASLFSKAGADFNTPQLVVILDPGHGGSDDGGCNGEGFKFNGKKVPEDEYVYDIAKRIERLIIFSGKKWKVFLTIRDSAAENEIRDDDEENIFPSDKNEFFNFYDKAIKVYSGREGLMQRMAVAEEITERYPHSKFIFISLHFDCAPAIAFGPRIIVPWEDKNKNFANFLKQSFLENGFSAIVGNREVPMIWGSKPGGDIDIFMFRGEVEFGVKNKVLLEFGNFNNEEDRRMLLNPDGREKYGQIIFNALDKFQK